MKLGKYSYEEKGGIYYLYRLEECKGPIFENPLIEAIQKIEHLIKENEKLSDLTKWRPYSELPLEDGEYLCKFSNGTYNYRTFKLPNFWGIDDERIVSWCKLSKE